MRSMLMNTCMILAMNGALGTGTATVTLEDVEGAVAAGADGIIVDALTVVGLNATLQVGKPVEHDGQRGRPCGSAGR